MTPSNFVIATYMELKLKEKSVIFRKMNAILISNAPRAHIRENMILRKEIKIKHPVTGASWNDNLLREVLPLAYAELILRAIDLQQQQQQHRRKHSVTPSSGTSDTNPNVVTVRPGSNEDIQVSAIYDAWPNIEKINNNWRIVLDTLFR